ncbi:MAG: hypothetical protein K9I48_05600 [Sphingobacteriales bacterium]|nr:hypothetical protein [Sphingobacteriales bacterium]
MEIQKMGHEKWVNTFASIETSLFNRPDFIHTIALAYQKQITWYVVSDKDAVLFSIPIYHSGRDASLVTHFFYQAIIIHQEFPEIKLLESWKELIVVLKSDFDHIEFKFAPYVKDIRPFLWADFEHSTRYTSIVYLATFPNYSENVTRSLKKAHKHNLSVNNLTFDQETVSMQILDMKKYGLGPKHAKRFNSWFSSLSELQNTRVFQLVDEESSIIGSSLFLYDKHSAYLVATMGGKDSSGGQAYLYDQAFNYFKELGISEVDLLGANIPSVALYKSKLGGVVEPYFMVSYHKHKFIADLTQKGKNVAKGMLKSLRIINK